ncbi:hypothetical protein HPP92_001785 [Vanilla planifolia]|uniref:EF-hand domain-containing protein n=1 Tax=Vanilla planifolia TaxID=51239 RepID=A0A835VLV9_VANPL|nr:hypothetical protein HPP92_001785 [Vanilla planifolia]
MDPKRERTPPRASRDRKGSSVGRNERPRRVSPHRSPPRRVSPRRSSPRREIVHRNRSPVKEKKREYICKVQQFCLIEAERDYLSINKRYPRLSISPEFSKVVLKWPNENLHLSLRTPVSFEHDFTEDGKSEEAVLASSDDLLKSTNVIWNAKVILMSGISSDALKELCSDKSSDERLIHFNNILRFAVLKKDHSFMAIGGRWKETLDGGNPSFDASSLIQTARRCVKDIVQLDLQNCQHWNPFIEIHYNRIGHDGLSSYKEVTVLFMPDLSECLPTIDNWQSQWLAHRQEIAEREQRHTSKKEKRLNEKESTEGKASTPSKIGKVDEYSSKDVQIGKLDAAKDVAGDLKMNENESKGKVPQQDKNVSKEKCNEAVFGDVTSDNKETFDVGPVQQGEGKKSVKKKVIRKVVKGSVSDSKATATTDEPIANKDDKLDQKDVEKKEKGPEDLQETESPELAKVKTFVRKRIVRKIVSSKPSQKEDNTDAEKKPEKHEEIEIQGDKVVNNKEVEVDAVQQTSGIKGKKRIIRRVIKKKVPANVEKSGIDLVQDGEKVEGVSSLQTTIKEEDLPVAKQEDLAESCLPEYKIKDEAETSVTVMDKTNETKSEDTKDDKNVKRQDDKISKSEKNNLSNSNELANSKRKDTNKDLHDAKGEHSLHEREKTGKDAKNESKQKSNKEVKEKGRSDEPPLYPGLLLKTKRKKESKIRSMSLSLGGLLEYNDKDIEESTFELSLFAESFNEMLQYQMGCRLLSFLEAKEEKSEQDDAEKSSSKRPRVTDKPLTEKEPLQQETENTSDQNQDESTAKDGKPAKADKSEVGKVSDNEIYEEEEELEEMFEEDDEMEDAAPAIEEVSEDKTEISDKRGNESVASTKDGKNIEISSEKIESESEKKEIASEKMENPSEKVADEPVKDEKLDIGSKDDKQPSTDKSASVKDEVIDMELLQAFRYFDYNKVGYIKLDDLRCILHDLGKFLSHRDVKV